MNFEEAKDMLARPAAPEISDHRVKLAAIYEESPQKAKTVDMALAGIEALIQELAVHGHHYQLVEAEDSRPVPFPTMVYRDDGKQLTVGTQGELDIALGDGWFLHPTERPEKAADTRPEAPMPDDPGPGLVGEHSNLETGEVPPVVLDPPEINDAAPEPSVNTGPSQADYQEESQIPSPPEPSETTH